MPPFVGGATPLNGEDVGLDKKAFVKALRGFDLLAAFPDLQQNYHAFRVDPWEPNRVWFQTRAFGTNTGDLMGKPATGKRLELPPEMLSMTFNADGQVQKFTVGYVLDRTVGNTGGLGQAFGLFWGVGAPLPIPECRPFTPSLPLLALGKIQAFLDGLGDA